MKTAGTDLKRIVIIRNAYKYDFGGGERIPVNLARVLIENNYLATVVSRSPKLLEYAKTQKVPAVRGWWWPRQNWSGFRILLIPAYLVWQILLTLYYFVLFIRLRADVVHAQSKDDFIAATIAARLLGKRCLWSDHADLKYVYLNTGVWYKNPVGKLVKACSRGAYAIIVTSQNDRQLIEEAAGQDLPPKYQVIYNGISDKPNLLNKHHQGDVVVFAATSRLVTAKGIGELIQAFLDIETEIKAELWLLGEGPEEKKFKDQAGGHPNIKFMGFPDDYLERLAEADVIVHPSYLEGFSVSLIEAAMLGKPIIACAVGGNPELIKDGRNGLLVPARDTGSLAQAMRKLGAQKVLRTKLGAAARKTYENHFIFEKIVKEKYIPLYEKP